MTTSSTVAGALFDFLGFLTSRDQSCVFGSREFATPAVELLGEWAATRGLHLDDANVHAWQAALSSASSGVGVLTDEERTHIKQAAQYLDEFSEWRNSIGYGESAEGASCSAYVLRRLLSRAILAATQRAEPVAQSEAVRDAMQHAEKWREFNGERPAPAAEAEPVGWTYELATRKAWAPTEHYTGWEWRLSKEKPNVPEGSVRNLRPLVYGDTRPAAPLSEGPRDDGPLAAAIHWPECWDTAAYPTARHALDEVYEHFRCTTCSPSPQPTNEKPDGWTLPKPCPHCDDTGDVTSVTGEWRGRCYCPAGVPTKRTAPQPTDEATDAGRIPATLAEAEIVIHAFLDREVPGWPECRVIPDGEHGWAFWINPDDTTSYLTQHGIQWLGSSWPDDVEYDELTGRFAARLATPPDNAAGREGEA